MCSGRGYWGPEASEEGAEVFVVRSLGESPRTLGEGAGGEGSSISPPSLASSLPPPALIELKAKVCPESKN